MLLPGNIDGLSCNGCMDRVHSRVQSAGCSHLLLAHAEQSSLSCFMSRNEKDGKKMKYVIGTIASFAIVGAAAASPLGLPTVSSDFLTAHSISDGQLVFGGGFTTDTPGSQVYDSGIADGTADNWGPFTGSVTDSVIRDDYTALSGGELTSFQFVGGVANDGEGITIFFLDADEEVVSGVNVTLPQGGNFVWTINLRDAGFEMADSGFVQIQHQDGGNVTWFVTSALNIGDNVFTSEPTGSWETTMYAFSMYATAVPAPGALALLGLAGLVGTRRRRA
jgi:MYXO-CTERM domain-containing protein